MKAIFRLFLIVCLTSQSFAQNQISQEKEIINGIVLDEDGNPFPGVSINIEGTTEGAQTNLYGNYSLKASIGETLIFSFTNYKTQHVKILNAKPINLHLEVAPLAKEQVVLTALGIERKKEGIAYSYKEIDNTELNEVRYTNIFNALSGRVSGLVLKTDGTGIILRGTRSLGAGNDTALIVVDGAVTNYSYLETIDPSTIEKVNVVKGAAGAGLYGSQGGNGVIIVKTKISGGSTLNKTKSNKPKRETYRGSLKIKNINSKPSYIEDLEDEATLEKAYELYKIEKENYKDNSSFFVDVYRYFSEAKNKEISKKVLNDIVISNIDNHETLKGLGMILQREKEYDFASSIYKRLLLLKSRDAQSFIDLAQIYADNGKTQRAFNLFEDLLQLTEGASKINGIVKNEINGILQTSKNIDASSLESHHKINTTFDIRILASWNKENANINLQVIDPSSEVASKENPNTELGGELVNVNDAFGPEEYTIINARKGDYLIGLKYLGNNEIKDKTIFVKLVIFKDFGKSTQTKEVKFVKLDKSFKKGIISKITI
ncbi:carboxypeptidase-like regulatory domain-containing protein [Lacinutrix algicola]|uniref:carboxypeptidase-like regulatory domain-containing protein n=1 Tax=Lacinutrix algicola TaxID=342954 RepID=UPI0006E44094|nr:carboxypeptidase-like regulatory domain-containing protein [Lacinutrix algicola]